VEQDEKQLQIGEKEDKITMHTFFKLALIWKIWLYLWRNCQN
jgi:hypothetical protein